MTEWRASNIDHSGSSSGVGASFARIAFLKPASSKAGCQASTPARTQGTSHSGVAGSIQKTIGSTGSETSALGSTFSSRNRRM